jgi:hypothetical protein
MPSKPCSVCLRQRTYSREEWKLVSGFPFIVCSRRCAWDFINSCPSPSGYISGAVRQNLGTPSEAYSPLLGRFFRSNYERYVAEDFSEHDITFEYEKWSFPVKGSFYTPDFHLPKHRLFVEVKGPWGASAKSKVTEFLRLYPKPNLLILPWTIAEEFYPCEK